MRTPSPTFLRRSLPILATIAICWWIDARPDPRLSDETVNAGTKSGTELYAPAEREGISFVLFGDRTTGSQAGLRVLEEGVRMANRLDPDFVMTVGDMVQGYNAGQKWLGQMRQYREIVDQLDAPWYPVAGNHDVYGENGRKGGNLDLYQEHFGPLYYSFDHKWAHVVVLFSDEFLSFSNPARNQNMGTEQLSWLREDLKRTEAEQVFVLLHHPRWTGQYRGCNWPEVHELLKNDGRVKAVFAGHQHRWRDDGVVDGIHYYVLAVTGGNSGPFKESADMQEIAHVRVRRDGFQMAVMPVGSVHGGDLVLGEEVDSMVKLSEGGWCRTSGAATLARDAKKLSSFVLTVRNPLDVSARFRVELPNIAGWTFQADQSEFTLAQKEVRDVTVLVEAPRYDGVPPSVQIPVALFYELKSGIVQPVRMTIALPTELDEVAEAVATKPKKNSVLMLDGKGSVRVPLDGYFKAFTLECWVRGEKQPSWQGLISKTNNSGFSLNWFNPYPDGNIGLQGVSGYLQVRAKKGVDWGKWCHLAFCWDGSVIRFFVNGKLVDEKPAKGQLRTNRLPLYIGADTTGSGNPEHQFTGAIDEVRISSIARYRRNFRPKKRFEPDGDTVTLFHFDVEVDGVFPDESGNKHHGWRSGSARLEVERVR